MAKYILAIDQGTTGTTTLLIDRDLNIQGKSTVEFPQHFPKPSWVEHDLNEIWDSVLSAVRQTFQSSGASPKEVAAIGITNQRETTCLWERNREGTPLARAIVWQDRRTADDCERLKKKGLEKLFYKRTGLRLDPYFSATKLHWLLKHVPGAKLKAREGKIAFGTIDSYLLYRLSGEHGTDVSNASRTLLMDLKKCEWDEELLLVFGFPPSILPAIRPSAVEYGRTRGFWEIPDGTPITGMAGDQQAALFGQACFSKGMAKCTYGTGAFALVNTGKEALGSKHGLVTTVAWQLGKQVTYGIEGSAFIAGAAVQWLRDGLKFFSRSADIEALANEVQSSDGMLFVPALSGMGAPHWLPRATGLITGITRGTTKAHLAYATLEGIAYQVAELMQAMGADYGKKITQLRVDGGASTNNLLMQMQANFLGAKVVRSEIVETTALGAGLQAGLGVGFWKDLNEIEAKWKAAETFEPKLDARIRKQKTERWSRAVRALSVLN